MKVAVIHRHALNDQKCHPWFNCPFCLILFRSIKMLSFCFSQKKRKRQDLYYPNLNSSSPRGRELYFKWNGHGRAQFQDCRKVRSQSWMFMRVWFALQECYWCNHYSSSACWMVIVFTPSLDVLSSGNVLEKWLYFNLFSSNVNVNVRVPEHNSFQKLLQDVKNCLLT